MAEILDQDKVMDIEEVKYAGYRDRFPVGFVRPNKYSDPNEWEIIPFSFMEGEESDKESLAADALACRAEVFDLDAHPGYRFMARSVHLG